jgi:hypothetical protein
VVGTALYDDRMGPDDGFNAIGRAHFVCESSLGDHIEREVVAKVFTRATHHFNAQT